jgi:glycosyltransferase involved in cell wall biosynthesis
MTIPVSVLIPVLNERRNIADCLRSVEWSDDVVVVDSGSTDGTDEVARSLGARVVQFQYTRGGPKKKNWALENVAFRHDWILIVDADERITEELAAEIARVTAEEPAPLAGYYISRRFYFLGRWIRHAGYFPSWNLRLLRKGRGRYEPVPDWSGGAGDNEVHEHVLLDGAAGRLKHPMDHYAYPSITAFVEKHNRYSTWEAQAGEPYLSAGEAAGRMARHLRARRRLKRIGRRLPCSHWLRFLYHYVIKLGFLDGVPGYVLCHLLAEYEFQIWAKGLESRAATQARLLGALRSSVELRDQRLL